MQVLECDKTKINIKLKMNAGIDIKTSTIMETMKKFATKDRMTQKQLHILIDDMFAQGVFDTEQIHNANKTNAIHCGEFIVISK